MKFQYFTLVKNKRFYLIPECQYFEYTRATSVSSSKASSRRSEPDSVGNFPGKWIWLTGKTVLGFDERNANRRRQSPLLFRNRLRCHTVLYQLTCMVIHNMKNESSK